jgi:16S rRNA (cytosine1407-C5)-methyltransferase
MTKRPKPIEAKRNDKRAQLLARIGELPGVHADQLTAQLSGRLQQSVRINPLKGDPAETLVTMRELGWQGEPVSWCENAFTISEGYEQLRDSELASQGRIYIQNSSSWLPVVALEPRPGERVLDVCAAPGGKTSHLAALMHGEGSLTANDNSRPRLIRMQRNLERLGVSATCTLRDATQLVRHFEDQQFDRILIDAPCSGEGLVDLDDIKSLDTWSVAHIKRLNQLQKRIISQAWQLLAPGGTLVYSTCTTAPEENELVIDWLLRRTPDAQLTDTATDHPLLSPGITSWQGREFHQDLSKTRRILPNSAGQELFFVAKLTKHSAPAMLH